MQIRVLPRPGHMELLSVELYQIHDRMLTIMECRNALTAYPTLDEHSRALLQMAIGILTRVRLYTLIKS